MTFFSDLAYSTYLGPFPLIAIIGIVTYVVLLSAAILAAGKRWSMRLRRIPVKGHRILAGLAMLLATVHLLMGLSSYV